MPSLVGTDYGQLLLAKVALFAVMGMDDVAGDLSRLATGRTVGSHPVLVRRMKEGESLRGVHLVFVGRRVRHSAGRASRQQGFALQRLNDKWKMIERIQAKCNLRFCFVTGTIADPSSAASEACPV